VIRQLVPARSKPPGSFCLQSMKVTTGIGVNLPLGFKEYRTNKNPFPKVDRVRPGHPTVANPRFGTVSARISPCGWVEIVQFRQLLDDSWLWAECHRNRNARRRSLWGCCPGGPGSDRRACGGARQVGNRAVAAEASRLSRWVRIFSMTSDSSMQAMIHTAPPQARQVSMSITRFKRCALRMEARRLLKSRGPKMTCVVPSRYGLFSW